jgi:hypothetical protein
MPSVIFSNMHPRDFDAFCALFNGIGWKVYVPSDQEPNPFGYGATTHPTKGAHTMVKYQEFLDIKPTVVLCLCWEQLVGAMRMAQASGSILVVRAGNNAVPYNNSHSKFLITNDTYTYHRCNIPNKLFFMLPPDYEFYSKQEWYRTSHIVTTFIHFYSKYWQASWHKYSNIRLANPDIAFINFGVVDDGSYNPNLTNVEDIRRMLGVSRCLLHVKEREGYGWSLLEAIACGIPVIAPKPYVVGKTCESFLIEDKTVVFLHKETGEFRIAFDNVDHLYKISEIAPKFIRELINAEEQYSKVKKFFEEVVLA